MEEQALPRREWEEVALMGFDPLNLSVRNLEETADGYRRVFGFARVEEGVWDGVPWAILRSNGGRGEAMLCVHERPELGGPDPGRHGIRHAGFRVRDRAACPTGCEIEVVPWKDGRVRFPSCEKEAS